jgi:hypothetical protein
MHNNDDEYNDDDDNSVRYEEKRQTSKSKYVKKVTNDEIQIDENARKHYEDCVSPDNENRPPKGDQGLKAYFINNCTSGIYNLNINEELKKDVGIYETRLDGGGTAQRLWTIVIKREQARQWRVTHFGPIGWDSPHQTSSFRWRPKKKK